MTSRLYTVRRPGPGRLSTMARPRGGDWLADELHALRRRGVDVVVCALTDAELADLELTGEAEAARAAGLAFVRVPIPDRGVPDRQAVRPALDALAAELATGRHVVVHCRYGIGRASLLAGAVLVGRGGVGPGAGLGGTQPRARVRRPRYRPAAHLARSPDPSAARTVLKPAVRAGRPGGSRPYVPHRRHRRRMPRSAGWAARGHRRWLWCVVHAFTPAWRSSTSCHHMPTCRRSPKTRPNGPGFRWGPSLW